MVGAIAGAISPPNPISHWDRLYLAAERGYILSTERGSGAHALRNPEGRNGREGRSCLCERGKSALRLRGEW
ncbi:MAG: hypothetical protein ACLFT9_23265 [Coleofasciculus sp.]